MQVYLNGNIRLDGNLQTFADLFQTDLISQIYSIIVTILRLKLKCYSILKLPTLWLGLKIRTSWGTPLFSFVTPREQSTSYISKLSNTF